MTGEDAHLAKFLAKAVPLKPLERSHLLENDEKLEAAYNAVACKGISTVPEDPSAEVDYHYICFVKSSKNGHLYELDGDKRGPVDHGLVSEESDLLSEGYMKVVKRFIEKDADLTGFSLMALAHAK